MLKGDRWWGMGTSKSQTEAHGADRGLELFLQSRAGGRCSMLKSWTDQGRLKIWVPEMTWREKIALPSHLWPVSRFPLWTRELIAPLNGDFLLMCAFTIIQYIILCVDTNSPSPLGSTITAFRTLKRQKTKWNCSWVSYQACSKSWLCWLVSARP